MMDVLSPTLTTAAPVIMPKRPGEGRSLIIQSPTRQEKHGKSRVRTRHHHDFLAVARYGGLQPCEGCDRRRGALVSARGPLVCADWQAGEDGTRYGE